MPNDPRIKFSISQGEGFKLSNAAGLAFDSERALLLVADAGILSFRSDNGAFVGTIPPNEQVMQYVDVALDRTNDCILAVSSAVNAVQVFSSIDGEREFEFDLDAPLMNATGIAIDHKLAHIIVADANSPCVHVLASIDGSFLFALEGTRKFAGPIGLAVDCERDRIIVTDCDHNVVRVFSSIDGSFLFEFGSYGKQPGQFDYPLGVCVANQGRIIVADRCNDRLQAFTHEGHHISSFEPASGACGVAFDEHRGLIAFSAYSLVHVIGANQWLADTKFVWRPDLHRYAPSWMKQAISTMAMIRSLVDESSAMSMIPNELLFEIFSFL